MPLPRAAEPHLNSRLHATCCFVAGLDHSPPPAALLAAESAAATTSLTGTDTALEFVDQWEDLFLPVPMRQTLNSLPAYQRVGAAYGPPRWRSPPMGAAVDNVGESFAVPPGDADKAPPAGSSAAPRDDSFAAPPAGSSMAPHRPQVRTLQALIVEASVEMTVCEALQSAVATSSLAALLEAFEGSGRVHLIAQLRESGVPLAACQAVANAISRCQREGRLCPEVHIHHDHEPSWAHRTHRAGHAA